MTPEQRRKKQERDRRYRAAHKEEINRKARERRAARKTEQGRREELLVLYRQAGAPWKYTGGEEAYLASVAEARERGASHQDIVNRMRAQVSITRRYQRGVEGDTGYDFWDDREDYFPDDEWYFYHGVFG